MDGGWKQIIEDFVEDFFRFYFPDIHTMIDFEAEIQFLDKELAKIMVDAQAGNRKADKLLQVEWLDGSVEWILLHVEVQAQRAEDFAERMYIYNYRIWDRYHKPVISLALLVDGDRNYRPDRFQREKCGCRLEFQFPTVKLLDHKTEAELLVDPNPFAIASLVQLRKLQAGSDKQRRYHFKTSLIRELYSRAYAKDDIIKLFRFMDYVLRLPEDLAIQFRSELESIEEKQNMPYVTSVERLAKEEGIEQGIEKGIRGLLLQAIQTRFNQVPDSLRESITECDDTDRLKAFFDTVLTAESLTDLPTNL